MERMCVIITELENNKAEKHKLHANEMAGTIVFDAVNNKKL